VGAPGVQASGPLANGGLGGAGGFGGGGGSGDSCTVGGSGLDYVAGGPGLGGTNNSVSSLSTLGPQPGVTTSTLGPGNWPNGCPSAANGQIATGGFPGILPQFSWVPGGLGAGGNGAPISGSGTSSRLGSGGGGGSGRIITVYTATLSANQTVTIGAGGTAGSGATGGNGTAGQPGCVGIWYWPVR
jgi:hypothetical protein